MKPSAPSLPWVHTPRGPEDRPDAWASAGRHLPVSRVRWCVSGNHHLCAKNRGTIVGRPGAFADRVRAQWIWVRPLPERLDIATTGPLLCGGVTVFAPLLIHNISPTARVGVIGIGGLGHMALQFANKWGCEVHAFTTSDSKTEEAKKLGAHFVHNTKNADALKKIAGTLDLIISTINVPIDVPGVLGAPAPRGRLHLVGANLEPMPVPALALIFGQKSISGSPTGSPSTMDHMLDFAARNGVSSGDGDLPDVQGERRIRTPALGQSALPYRTDERRRRLTLP